mmetsp:Transcript_38986/g.72550  ORF Transcript_38986/g.72550 Transcript_38986/m.72550 type:complete len:438 (+) Transcript_38986:51-1364(+)
MAPPVAGVAGNWLCLECANVNFASREVCNRCAAPKPAVVSTAIAHKSPRAPRAPLAGVDGNWGCSDCGNVNFAHREFCNSCQRPKHRKSEAPVAGINGNWACAACNNVNFSSRDNCNLCGLSKEEAVLPAAASPRRSGPPVAGVDGNWACGDCGNVNFGKREVCNICQAPKFQTHVGHKRGAGGVPVAGMGGNWACENCQNVNFPHRDLCNICQSPKNADGKLGNWSCHACGNINFPHRESCNACQAPKSQDQAHQPPTQTQNQAWNHAGGPRKGPVAGVDGNWLCGLCNNVNFPSKTVCNRCGEPPAVSWGGVSFGSFAEPQTVQKGKARGPTPGVDGNWLCAACQNVNFAHRLACNRCQDPKPGPPQLGGAGKGPVAGQRGNWKCPLCNNVNYPHRDACNRCGEPKVPAADDMQDAGQLDELDSLFNPTKRAKLL